MNLSTTYLGMSLKNPLVASASPLSESVAGLKRLEDAGISAVVHYSLFEEELTGEALELDRFLSTGEESYAEALSFTPEPACLTMGPEEYLQRIAQAKEALDIPVIGSLNGFTTGGWLQYARLIQEAGADALELNVYWIPTDPAVDGAAVERNYFEIVRTVKESLTIPVAVKLSPYFSAFANVASRLDSIGADGLVLFNRFYQPDIDLEQLRVRPNLILSTPEATRLPLRWIAILYGRVRSSLAATSGVHSAEDALKLIMAGADVTMLCASLLKHGVQHVEVVLSEMREWMEENEYESIVQMKGSMSQQFCPDPEMFERANYFKALRSYRVN